MDGEHVLRDFKDIETKLGRKVPESLIRSLAGGNNHHDKHEDTKLATPKNQSNSADLKRLESKMLFLRQEMVSDCLQIYLIQSVPVGLDQ